jgi:hypothetical protein
MFGYVLLQADMSPRRHVIMSYTTSYAYDILYDVVYVILYDIVYDIVHDLRHRIRYRTFSRATFLPGHTLTDYLQLCHHRFEGKPPLQPHLSPFLLLFTHKGGQTGHRTPRLRGVYATAHAKSPSSSPTERMRESFGGIDIGTVRLSDASKGGPHGLNRIQDIVEPCGPGHSGRHLTHTGACFMPTG